MRWLFGVRVYTFAEVLAACVLTGLGVWFVK